MDTKKDYKAPIILRDAIEAALGGAPTPEQAPDLIEAHILDYLSGRFTKSILDNPDCENELHKLFNEIRGH